MKTVLRVLLICWFCAVGSNALAGVIVAWGASEGDLVLDVPDGNDFVAVTAGRSASGYFGMALRTDGSIATWGNDSYGVISETPTGTGFTAISTWRPSRHEPSILYYFPFALNSEGDVVSWGNAHPLEPMAPCTAIAGGTGFAVGLGVDGCVHAMTSPEADPSPTFENINSGSPGTPGANSPIVSIDAGYNHALALDENGYLTSWGEDTYGQVSNTPTESGFTKISAGHYNSLALKSNGTIVAWGRNINGEVSNAPTGTGFTDIAAGIYNLAIASDGSIVSWGGNATSPTGYGFTDVATYSVLGLAIRSTTPLPSAGENDTAYVDGPVTGSGGEQTVGSTIIGNGGELSMPDSGTLNATNGITIDDGGTLSGGGTFNGDVDNNGTIDSDGFFSGDIVNYGIIHSEGGTLSGNVVNYGTIYCSGGTFLSGTFINYGSIFSLGPSTSGGGAMINYGTISCDGGESLPGIDNQGILDPGKDPSIVSFDDDFSQTADGMLLTDIGGYTQGEDYDFVHVAGSASLAGLIDVSLVDGFSPNLGDAFTIMTADNGITIGDGGLAITGDGNFSWQIVEGTSLKLVAVPEPSFIVLLAAASLFIAVRPR